ncbi:hypothetical protein M9458_023112, partial [Cirrhinus mrigala]
CGLHTALQYSSVHESAPEASSDHKSAPEAIHESTPEISSDHESAPVPSEVAAPAAEPPKGATSSYELSARPVTAMEATSELSPCHVTAKEANHEFSACSVMAKEVVHELSALLWGFLLSSALLWWSSASPCKSSDSSVPLLGSLLLSALLCRPPALPALPWLQAPRDLTWWTSATVFYCLPLLHGPGPPVFHCLPPLHGPVPPVFHCLPLLHSPGPPVLLCLSLLHDPGPPPLHGHSPPSHPLVYLVPTTLLDCCFL